MKVYAVIDTNVFVSALLTRNPNVATAQVLKALQKQHIKLLYNEEIMKEYSEVLIRPKFHLPTEDVKHILNFIEKEGIPSFRIKSQEFFPDPKDIVFYEVALSKEDAYLVAGNTKHFPVSPIVVTPAEMVQILEEQED